ncbi:hypothetical protein [Acidiferrobacter thiooxydans]|jgi:hypothetical protein|nr:hypothetical protein [Acidiferrobacter thiooxydans]
MSATHGWPPRGTVFITMLELRELAPDLRLLPEAIDRQADAAA